MARQVQVTIPLDLTDTVLAYLENEEYVFALYDFPGPDSVLIIFKMAEKRVGAVLKGLADNFEIGRGVGCVDIVVLASTLPRLAHYHSENQVVKKKAYAWTDRMTVEEIFDTIDNQSHLTFDYLAMVFVAALIAAMGLLTDSSVTVVASMLVSPLMGPILCVSFGAVIKNTEMVKRGLKNEMFGVAICISVGIVAGLVMGPMNAPGGIESSSFGLSANAEINGRGYELALVVGLCVAIPSGCAVALGITGGGINALAGVAISAALLPPIVNGAICLMISVWYYAHSDPIQTSLQWYGANNTSSHVQREHRLQCYGHMQDCNIEASTVYLEKSGISFALFLLNFLVIFICSYLTFKLKRVSPSDLTKQQARTKTMEKEQSTQSTKADGDSSVSVPAQLTESMITDVEK